MAAPSGSARLRRCMVSPAGRHSASLIFLHGSGDSGQGLRTWIKQVLNQDLTFQHIKVIYPTAPPRILVSQPEIEPRLSTVKALSPNRWTTREFPAAAAAAKSLQSCPTLCDPIDGSPPGSPVPGILQARTLEPYTPLKGGISNVWFDRLKISNDCPEHLESIDVMCQVLTDLIDDEVKTGIKKNRILVGGFSMGGCMAMHLAYRNHQDVAGVFALSSFLNKASAVYQETAERRWSLFEDNCVP
ncbi:lysophospholipase-like protein 1 isoform X2 [Bubalus kerabau]|uniref:lysophospholipase-like protein 1 isoform X2 n=1 Tax=Bubalus carabanensis TaxID=3119969 RepID=UPI00244EEEA8|nr:lysophospholipase-like protein 1 isoform X2 [Bubalus carabanensis]